METKLNSRDTAVADRLTEFADEVEGYFDSLLILGTYRDKISEHPATKVLVLERGNSYAIESSAMAYLDGEFEPETDEKD